MNDKQFTKIMSYMEEMRTDLTGRMDKMDEDSNSRFDKLFNYVQETREDLTEQVNEVKESQSSIMETIDYLVGKAGDLTDENLIGTNMIVTAKDKIEDHELRITKLEKAVA